MRCLNLSVASHNSRISFKRSLSSYMDDLICDPSPEGFNGVAFGITSRGFSDEVGVPQHDNLTEVSLITYIGLVEGLI